MYTNAQYLSSNGINTSISCLINGELWFIPLDPANADYANIMALVKDNKLTIAPAEEQK